MIEGMGQPNLLFIFTDEQRADTLDLMLDGQPLMPHLQAFAATATRVQTAYCTQPVCTPSRASIMSGLYPHATGATTNNLPLDRVVKCLPELLPAERQRDYATAYIGKWHLGDEIFAQHGFETWRSIEDEYRRFYGPDRDRAEHCTYYHWLRGHGFQPDLKREDGFVEFSRERAACLPLPYGKPAFLAEETTRFIAQQAAANRPFIAYVNFLEPHMPFFGPTSETDLPRRPLPRSFDAVPGDDVHPKARAKARAYREKGFEWYDLAGKAGWERMQAGYDGLCRVVDDAVARMLDALEAAGVAEDTIVVFTSDHGEMMGAHRLLGKEVMYRESLQVPLLLRVPGGAGGGSLTGPFSQIDLVPTLLDLLGEEVPDGLHGKSRAELFRAGGGQVDEPVFVGWNPRDASAVTADPIANEPVRTVITPDGWRYSHSPVLGQHELFDWNTDSDERINRVREPGCAQRVKEMRRLLGSWQAQVADLPAASVLSDV